LSSASMLLSASSSFLFTITTFIIHSRFLLLRQCISTPIVFEIVNKITGSDTVVISLLDCLVICFCFVLRYRRVRLDLHRACKVVVVFFALCLCIVYHLQPSMKPMLFLTWMEWEDVTCLEFSSRCRFRGSRGVAGGVVRPPTASEPKGRQNEYFKCKKLIFCAYLSLSYRDK
jgi:hypothetical protein